MHLTTYLSERRLLYGLKHQGNLCLISKAFKYQICLDVK